MDRMMWPCLQQTIFRKSLHCVIEGTKWGQGTLVPSCGKPFAVCRPGDDQLNRAELSCKLASVCNVCAVVPKPLAPRMPSAGVNEISDSVPKRLYRYARSPPIAALSLPERC